MLITFRILLKGALRDRISLFFAIIFPVVFLVALGFIFPTAGYRRQLLAGMLAMCVLFFSLNGIAFESLVQRNSGVYKLLQATPYRNLAFLVHLTAARGVVCRKDHKLKLTPLLTHKIARSLSLIRIFVLLLLIHIFARI